LSTRSHGTSSGEKKSRSNINLAEEPNLNFDLYSDTTARLTGSIKSWAQVYEILKEEKSTIYDDGSKERRCSRI
jgi:hypothetical protein